MSTSQRAVMFCGWGVKAGMVYLQVKLCDPCLSAFETLCGKMRYTNRRILYMKHLQSSTRHTQDTTLSSFNLTGVFGHGTAGSRIGCNSRCGCNQSSWRITYLFICLLIITRPKLWRKLQYAIWAKRTAFTRSAITPPKVNRFG